MTALAEARQRIRSARSNALAHERAAIHARGLRMWGAAHAHDRQAREFRAEQETAEAYLRALAQTSPAL